MATTVIIMACQKQSVRNFWLSHQQPNSYHTICALAGVSLYSDTDELLRFGIEGKSSSS